MTTSKYKGRTEAQKRADARYKDKNCDRLAIMLPKGHKVIYQEAATMMGLSWRQFVIASMDYYLKHELKDFPLRDKIKEVEIKKSDLNSLSQT